MYGNRLRILMTTDTIGGVWTYTQSLTTELLVRGCAVTLVSFGRSPSQEQIGWGASLAQRFEDAFLFVSSDTPLEWMQENDRAFADAEPLLLDTAEQFGADLLLSSQYCFGALNCALPRVVVAHSDVLSWAHSCRQFPLPESPWLARYCSLVRSGLARADAVVAPTRWMLNALADEFALPRIARVIPNGQTIAAPIASEPRLLQAVTAGRLWDEAKNLSMLALVRSPLPLLVAGEQSHETSMPDCPLTSARMLGRLDHDELIRLFSASAVYICPSLYEPFGLAPLEAALCGCAVLANDIPSLREVWGDCALFFQDADSLSALLAKLTADRGFLRQAQSRSLQRAQRFSAGAMAASYLDLFHSLLPMTEAAHHVA